MLFVVKLTLATEAFEIGYPSLDSCLTDEGLRGVFDVGGVASVWSGSLRITRDIASWERFREQIIANSTTLLRGGKRQ